MLGYATSLSHTHTHPNLEMGILVASQEACVYIDNSRKGARADELERRLLGRKVTRIESHVALMLIAWHVSNERGGPAVLSALQLLLAREAFLWIGRRDPNRTRVDQETVETIVLSVTLA